MASTENKKGYTYEYFNDDNGKLICKIEWLNGKISKETRYNNDIVVYLATYSYSNMYVYKNESVYENEHEIYRANYNNGVKIYETIYEKGIMRPQQNFWYDSGKKAGSIKYDNGIIDESWYENGVKSRETVSYSLGNVKYSKTWYQNGQLGSEYYDNGTRHYVYWHENGIKHKEYETTRDNRLIILTCFNDNKGRDLILREGKIIVWRQCMIVGNVLVCVKLLVPADSKRRTTRYAGFVEYAQVLEIKDKTGNQYESCISIWQNDRMVQYKVGQMVHRNDSQPKGIYVCKYQDQIDL